MNPNEMVQTILRALAREQQVTAQLEAALTAANTRIAELEAKLEPAPQANTAA